MGRCRSETCFIQFHYITEKRKQGNELTNYKLVQSKCSLEVNYLEFDRYVPIDTMLYTMIIIHSAQEGLVDSYNEYKVQNSIQIKNCCQKTNAYMRKCHMIENLGFQVYLYPCGNETVSSVHSLHLYQLPGVRYLILVLFDSTWGPGFSG